MSEYRNYDILKYQELKDECKRRGLSAGGKKGDLVSRLQEYDSKNGGAVVQEKRPLDEVPKAVLVDEGGAKKPRTDEADFPKAVLVDEREGHVVSELQPSADGPAEQAGGTSSATEAAAPPSSSSGDHDAGKKVDAAVAVEVAGGPATNSIYITGLVRPFTEDSFRAYLVGDGHDVVLVDLWMDNPVKSMAIARFSSAATAESVRRRIDGIVWPKLGKALVAVPCTQDHLRLKPAELGGGGAAAAAPAAGAGDRPASMDVDDLFEKTTAKPPLYYTFNKKVE